jgi:glutamate racemase
MNASPIGIFDSGIGGLTVFRAVRKQLPQEDIVYFGDTARVPYGTKSKETITRFSVDNVHFLEGFNVKMVIVACNTASSLSLDVLQKKFSIPVIGVIEPGAREAVRRTKNGRIGVIGTKSTIGSNAYETWLKSLDPSIEVYSGACPLFVPFVEEGWLDGEVVSKVVRTYLDGFKAFKVDTLILGCTHYPLLSRTIQKIMGPKVRLVNSGEETAKEAKRLLSSLKLTCPARKKLPELRYFVSDEPEQFRTLGERFLGSSIACVAKVAEQYRQPGFDRRTRAHGKNGGSGVLEGPFVLRAEA